MKQKESPAIPDAAARLGEPFATRLKSWRRLNNLTQAALGQMLGVSQPAVARWESGLDQPSAERLGHIRSLMAGAMRNELAIERLFIRRQAAMRALFDYDGVKLLEMSEGFRNIWPDFSTMVGVAMADHVIGEVQQLVANPDIDKQIRTGGIGIISGVSYRHTDYQLDTAIRHRWHMCFRRFGGRSIADIVYELCGQDEANGVTDIIYLDALAQR
jgi:transcriptional regulator with XRE-family HTH domain